MLSFFKKKSRSEPEENPWKIEKCDGFRVSHPKSYIVLREGTPDVSGLCIPPGNTIGVLRFSAIKLEKGSNTDDILLRAKENDPQGEEVKIGTHRCWHVVNEERHSSNDYIFWADTGEAIRMDVYFFTEKDTLFFVTYRVPISKTEDESYEPEKEIISKIIASLKSR